MFEEAEENTEIIGGGDGDQSDCGGLSTRPRPDPEELLAQRGGGVSGPVQRVPPAAGHQPQVEMTFVSSATAHPTLDEDGRRELFLQLTLVSPAEQVDEKVSDDIRVIS